MADLLEITRQLRKGQEIAFDPSAPCVTRRCYGAYPGKQ